MSISNDDRLADEMRSQLTFLFGIKEDLKDLDDRIRAISLFLARSELIGRHRNIMNWEVLDRPDETTIMGSVDGGEKVIARIRTMSLHGKSSFGGRQHEAMKKNLERIADEKADSRYFFLLDPWTVKVVQETFGSEGVTILPLLKDDMASVVRPAARTVDDNGTPVIETISQMVEEVITREEFPEERTIVSPISRTSIRQGFLYIPKEKGHLLQEGPVTIWIRKDASLETKCMISQTGGVRLGGGLTKWFRSIDLHSDDELLMGSQDNGSLLVLMIRRSQNHRGQSPVIETMKWE
ncbi:MAG: hypothetical protein JXA22_04165 [Candidatus Thermoplasmatota archaeon]|nr:hypothetical protein [Candidatus Thermoplasmatota archaeon]